MNGTGLAVALGVLAVGSAGMVALFGPFGEKPGLRGIVEDNRFSQQQGEREGEERNSTPVSTQTQQPGRANPLPPNASPPANPPAASPKKFPLAENIPAGMEKWELLRRFGPPAIHSTSVEGGVTQETLVYEQHDPERKTFVFLRGGRVVSAATWAY